MHAAVDTLGHLLALSVTPANQQDRDQVEGLVEQVQQVTGEQVEVAYVDQGYSGEQPAAAHGIRLEVIEHSEAKRGFLLLPRRWVVERDLPGWHASAAWSAITRDWPKPWPASTSSPSPASCSRGLPPS